MSLSWADRRRNEALELIANAGGSVTWVELSQHCNGFVREAAVKGLSAHDSPESLLALIERLNDWVPQVRELASAGVAPYLTTTRAQALLFALDAVMALAMCQRVDHQATVASVREVLQSPDVRQEVYRSFMARQGESARYLFALLLEVAESPDALVRDALAHRELTVRLAAVVVCETLPAGRAVPLLREALPRAAAKVRVRVLRALLPLLDDPRPVLRQALLDASPSIRSLAQWHAPRHNLDATAVLADRLTGEMPTGKRNWLGLLGLAAQLSAELPQAWRRAALRSRYPTVRFAAVRTAGDGASVELLDALDDPSDRVFGEAIVQLDKLPWSTVNAGLSRKLDSDWHALSETRRQAILRLISGWQQLAYLLKRLDAEPVMQVFWLREITQWCDRQYQVVDPVTPKTERELLMARLQSLATAGRVLGKSVARVVA